MLPLKRVSINTEFGTPGPLEPKGVQASVQAKEDAQDLKSCEGFPREGSSPSPGTMESIGYENRVFPEKAEIGVL